jgi:hypothetical protein
MRSIVAATAVCLAPLAAQAAPIHYDFLTVEYEGTISFVTNNGGLGWATCCDDPKIGDSVSGSLRVNLHNLPADKFPTDPRRADYSASRAQPSYSSSFVSGGKWKPDTGPSGDRLIVEDGIGGRDLFDVADIEGSRERGPFESRQRPDGLYLLAGSSILDFIQGDGPVQSFEITADQLDESSHGFRSHARFDIALGEFFGGFYRFAIDKLKVTPGRCMAP